MTAQWFTQHEHGGFPIDNRFYIVEVMPSLFGEWTVLREWGRRGSPGTVRLSSYERRMIKHRLQHGYKGRLGG